ncbi:hypothetical protein DSO57_1030301 [Entomophthora muscae]|uniref:Uncharacterized protein n=1 Tax=Entomophthora muscae TaxID=34485 RepID=A0ACC2TC14_9FUNG|nr:hypothetical protein DSO57_1030301 [Entomophthora muscae]
MHLLCAAVVVTPAGQNRVSATQVPIEEEDGRGEFNSDAALIQPVKGAQAARVQSINPWVPKMTQKPTKVTTIKTVRNKEVEVTSYVFDPMYHQELVLSAIMKKVKPVLDTSYEPYVSDGNQEDNNEPEFYRTVERQLVLKKIAAFYNKVPMLCAPVSNQDLDLTTPANPAQKRIPDIKCIILLRLIRESGDYKAAAALVEVDPKYTSKVFVISENLILAMCMEKYQLQDSNTRSLRAGCLNFFVLKSETDLTLEELLRPTTMEPLILRPCL